MKDHEFDQWVTHLTLKLPEVSAWMKKQPVHEQQQRLKDWRETLRYTDLPAAKAGLEAIYNDELAMPRAFNKLPVVVRGYALDNRPQAQSDSEPVFNYETGQYSFKCLECDDIGMITVVRADTQVMMRDQPENLVPSKYAECAVACNCEKGKRLSNRRKHAMPQYNERTMLRCHADGSTREEKIEVLRHWMDNRPRRDISEHSNYNDFGEFS
jgi:hypothetical protein